MTSRPPVVSFVVPCFKLAHLLAECVDSILTQTYEDFEILVMDDCSPDDTPAVARSFQDGRVRYIRNEQNLGHLRNYNKGITLARGRYLWLISADDRLRDPSLLSRYVRILDTSPEISFAFCPGVEIDGNGRDIGVPAWMLRDTHDRVFTSDEFLGLLMERNRICTPSALARRELYLRASLFPLDLPYSGDWFLWGAFAMAGSVAYVAKPSVDYRIHAGGMTHQYRERAVQLMIHDEIAVRWRLLRLLRSAGRDALADQCVEAIVDDYAARLRPRSPAWMFGLTAAQFEASVAQEASTHKEAAVALARTYDRVGDYVLAEGATAAANSMYRAAFKHAPWSATYLTKCLLSMLGPWGLRLRAACATARAAIL